MPISFIVLMSWVFVVTRFVHAGIFVTSNDVRHRSTGMVRGRAGAARDVDLFRAEDSAADLSDIAIRSNRKFAMTPAARLSAAIELIDTIDDPACAGGEGAEGMGHRAPLCRLGRSRRDLRAWSGTCCAGSLERLDHGDDRAARARCSACSGSSAGWTPTPIAALCDGSRFAPAPLTEAERDSADVADSLRRALATSPATIRNGSTRISRRSLATIASPRRPRWRAARRSTCASTR